MELPGRLSRRQIILGSAAALVSAGGIASCSAAPQPGQAVRLPEFRRRGDRDDTDALVRAFATGRPVHAPAGGGSGADGRYRIGADASASLPAGATLFGDGLDRTIIARSDAGSPPFILYCDSGSPDPDKNISGLRFHDLTFVDDVAKLGFSEFSYLVMLNGVSDVRFERVGFRGFRGDGLHLGSSVTGGTERHNRDVTVSDCVFDGINANNRNAISVIDGDGIVIEGSQFLNVTRRGDGTANRGDPMNPATGLAQPGAIDLEPNGDAFAVIRNVTIRRNMFSSGGGFAVSMLLLPNDKVRIPQQTILIENNIVKDRVGGFQAFGFTGKGALASRHGYDITIRGNRVDRCDKPFILSGIRSADITNNVFRDCRGHAELGYQADNAAIRVTDNIFERVGGPPPGYALWLRSGTDIAITGNDFIDAGTPGGKSGVGIAVVKGDIRKLTMRGNTFSSPQGRMAQAAMVFRDGNVDQATLHLNNNRAIGLALAQALNPPR